MEMRKRKTKRTRSKVDGPTRLSRVRACEIAREHGGQVRLDSRLTEVANQGPTVVVTDKWYQEMKAARDQSRSDSDAVMQLIPDKNTKSQLIAKTLRTLADIIEQQ